jgi:hypothetical protein
VRRASFDRTERIVHCQISEIYYPADYPFRNYEATEQNENVALVGYRRGACHDFYRGYGRRARFTLNGNSDQ